MNQRPRKGSEVRDVSVRLWVLADAVGTLAFAAVCLMPVPNVQLSTERK